MIEKQCLPVSGIVCIARNNSKVEVAEETAMEEGEPTTPQHNRNDRSISELGIICLRNEVKIVQCLQFKSELVDSLILEVYWLVCKCL